MPLERPSHAGDYRVVDVVRDVKIHNSMGSFNIACVRVQCASDLTDHLAIYRSIGAPLTLRIQSGCALGHVFGDVECDCKTQFDKALALISAQNEGMVIYTPSHDARGRGILSKLQVYRYRQDHTVDSLTACSEQGLPFDTRDFREFCSVLDVFNVKAVTLLGASTSKSAGLRAGGISVLGHTPL